MGSDDTSTYPGSGPSSPEVKKPYILLVLYYEHTVAIMLLELCLLEEDEDKIDPSPTLRVQAPLYRQGPGYTIWSVYPTAGFVVAMT
jgi:hypothetical protein